MIIYVYFFYVNSRTLTAVHDSILEDLCFPAEIVGKRVRVKLDGSKVIKVHLDKSQQNNVEHKVNNWAIKIFLFLNVFTKVYKKFCEMAR